MEENKKPEVVDVADELASLFDNLGIYDKKIFELKAEIEKAEEFILTVSGSESDRVGLEKSLGMEVYRAELAKHEVERNRIIRSIASLEKDRFGEEIPRSQSGKYQIPWDEMRIVESSVDSVFRDR